MSEISKQIITYQNVIDGVKIDGDDYEVAAYALAIPRKEAFLNNPFVTDREIPMLYLQKVDGIVAGRMMFFPSRFYNGVEVKDSCGASSLEVHEKYRDLSIGADLAMFPVFQMNNKILIYADFSGDGLDACRALKYNVFTLPKLYYFQHSFALYESIGIKGTIGKALGYITDRIVGLYRKMVDSVEGSLKEYRVESVKIVPDWIDDVVENDGHKYMELHDHVWFQWNLDNMFHRVSGNKNEFYIVTRNGKNLGFFMTKTRFRNRNSERLTSKITGGIMEWGTFDQEMLSEYQIYRLALSTFDSKVDFITMAIENNDVQKRMKKRWIFKRGEHAIAFKDIKKQYKDAADQKLWRLRYGYADSILN